MRAARQLRLDVKMAPDLFGCEPMRETERIGDIPLISLHEERLPVAGLLVKRALDVVGASAALIVAAPVLALLAVLVKLDSPGPVLYAALRAGRKGRPFRCYKFRTMVQDAAALKEKLRERIAASRKTPAPTVSLRIPAADLALARKQAEQKGLPYQTYIKSLLHETLTEREKRKLGR